MFQAVLDTCWREIVPEDFLLDEICRYALRPFILRILSRVHSDCIEAARYRKLETAGQEDILRCARCGNENPADNRFCGMCGSTLLAAPPIAESVTQRAASAVTEVPVSAPVVTPAVRPPEPPRAPARPPSNPVPRPPARVEEESPVVSGPSFLGLNNPGPRSRGDLSINPESSSRSLDYLLDDEEPAPGGGSGKIIALLIIVALLAGFGYMTWRHEGVGWLTSMFSKRPAATQASSDTDSALPSGTAPESQTPPGNQPVPAAAPAQPAASTPSDATSPVHSAATPNGTTADATPARNEDAKSDDAKTDKAATPADNADDDSSAEDKAPVATPAPAPKLAKPKAAIEKPALKTHAAAPLPSATASESQLGSVSEAQKYIYGRGAPQDCDRGLRLLKPAANRSDPKAMIEMGALYSAGLCTPRDLPTAYRWFALALRKDPDNLPVQKDLQKLWGEMTQPERQLAIKLTQ